MLPGLPDIGAPPAHDPARVDLFERATDPDAINLAVGREPADQHRNVVLAAVRIGDIFEQKGLALALRQAAELQPHQRMELGVLVDRHRHAHELAGLLEPFDISSEGWPVRCRHCERPHCLHQLYP